MDENSSEGKGRLDGQKQGIKLSLKSQEHELQTMAFGPWNPPHGGKGRLSSDRLSVVVANRSLLFVVDNFLLLIILMQN